MKNFSRLISIILVLLFVSTTMNSQTPYAISIHGGYSWLNGVVGAEAQFGYFGISGGWMPTKMPISKEKISSIGFAASIYSGDPNGISYTDFA